MTFSLKRVLEKSLVRSGIAYMVQRFSPIDTLILAYHNIVPEGGSRCGERSLHLPLQEFRRQLDLLQELYQVVPLEKVTEYPVSAERPRAVITFDDAYQGAITAGLVEVVGRGLSATIFVCPGHVGGRTFWWDECADPATGLVPADVRQEAIEGSAGRCDVFGGKVGREGSSCAMPRHASSASLEDLEYAATQPGIALGSHAWDHPNLTRLSDAALIQELADSLAWLRERFEKVIPWLSYPYGLTSPRVRRAAAAAGYRGGVLVNGGVVRDRQKLDLYAVPRVNVPAGLSLEGFRLRMAGLRA